jgi:hypothetical protein
MSLVDSHWHNDCTDPAELHISFQATQAHYAGSTFLKPAGTSPTATAPLAMLYLEVIAPPADQFGTSEFKAQLLTRLKKEVDDWISSSFHFKSTTSSSTDLHPSAQPAGSTGLTSAVEFSDVIPVIEYRQMQYGHHVRKSVSLFFFFLDFHSFFKKKEKACKSGLLKFDLYILHVSSIPKYPTDWVTPKFPTRLSISIGDRKKQQHQIRKALDGNIVVSPYGVM